MDSEWYPGNTDSKLDFAANCGLPHRLVAEASYPQGDGRGNAVHHQLLSGLAAGLSIRGDSFLKIVI